ncbi:MAG TPA: DUF732 domain-containing protein [Mycobacteriales bacterium]|nr:DUF732 domain-containing protein [Mycobacteriales bacterium]
MSTQHTRTSIATGACLTFGIAVAVAVGAVPQVSSPDHTAPAAVHGVVQPSLARLLLDAKSVVPRHAAAHRHHQHALHANRVHVTAPVAAGSATAAAPKPASTDLVSTVTVEPATSTGATAESANLKHAAAHHKKKHHKKKHHKKTHKPAQPQKAVRTTPSASAVSGAISGLRNFVHTPLTPTSAQVAQFGDEVCDAFDNGSTFAQVKAVILDKVKQLPFTTVTAGAADYVVKTAVSLYCPGYKSKVS